MNLPSIGRRIDPSLRQPCRVKLTLAGSVVVAPAGISAVGARTASRPMIMVTATKRARGGEEPRRGQRIRRGERTKTSANWGAGTPRCDLVAVGFAIRSPRARRPGDTALRINVRCQGEVLALVRPTIRMVGKLRITKSDQREYGPRGKAPQKDGQIGLTTPGPTKPAARIAPPRGYHGSRPAPGGRVGLSACPGFGGCDAPPGCVTPSKSCRTPTAQSATRVWSCAVVTGMSRDYGHATTHVVSALPSHGSRPTPGGSSPVLATRRRRRRPRAAGPARRCGGSPGGRSRWPAGRHRWYTTLSAAE